MSSLTDIGAHAALKFLSFSSVYCLSLSVVYVAGCCPLLLQNTERLSVWSSSYHADPAVIPDGLLSTTGRDEQSDSRVSVLPAATSGADGGCCVPGENTARCCDVCILHQFIWRCLNRCVIIQYAHVLSCCVLLTLLLSDCTVVRHFC